MKTKQLWKSVVLTLAIGVAAFLSPAKEVAAQGGPSLGVLNEILAAIPRSGIVRRTVIDPHACVTVAGPIDPGRHRAPTITIETTNIDGADWTRPALGIGRSARRVCHLLDR